MVVGIEEPLVLEHIRTDGWDKKENSLIVTSETRTQAGQELRTP